MRVYRMESHSNGYTGERKGLRPKRLGVFAKYYPQWGRDIPSPWSDRYISDFWNQLKDSTKDFYFACPSPEIFLGGHSDEMLDDCFVAVYEVVSPILGEGQVVFHKDLARFVEEIPLSRFLKQRKYIQ